jgi:hypothetical protein
MKRVAACSSSFSCCGAGVLVVSSNSCTAYTILTLFSCAALSSDGGVGSGKRPLSASSVSSRVWDWPC